LGFRVLSLCIFACKHADLRLKHNTLFLVVSESQQGDNAGNACFFDGIDEIGFTELPGGL